MSTSCLGKLYYQLWELGTCKFISSYPLLQAGLHSKNFTAKSLSQLLLEGQIFQTPFLSVQGPSLFEAVHFAITNAERSSQFLA